MNPFSIIHSLSLSLEFVMENVDTCQGLLLYSIWSGNGVWWWRDYDEFIPFRSLMSHFGFYTHFVYHLICVVRMVVSPWRSSPAFSTDPIPIPFPSPLLPILFIAQHNWRTITVTDGERVIHFQRIGTGGTLSPDSETRSTCTWSASILSECLL